MDKGVLSLGFVFHGMVWTPLAFRIMDTLYNKYGYKTGFYRIGFSWLVFLDIDSLSSLDIDSLSSRK